MTIARDEIFGPVVSVLPFKSMDEVLSFHIGLIARVMARQARKAPDRPEPRLERTRRQWEQAAEAQEEADEAEEFQAVGARCFWGDTVITALW